jgi:deoxyribodipyrimidine photo-lyase
MINLREQPLESSIKPIVVSPKSIVYIVSRDIRVKDNHALSSAWLKAKELDLNLVVIFNLNTKVKNRIKNHYRFLLNGLNEFKKDLQSLNIPLLLTIDKRAKDLAILINQDLLPAHIFFDFSPLNGPKNFKSTFINHSSASCSVIDTHNVIPPWIVSNKEEFSAKTIRPRITKFLPQFLKEDIQIKKLSSKPDLKLSSDFLTSLDIEFLLSKVQASDIPNYTPVVEPGESAALNTLELFIRNTLQDYYIKKNDFTLDSTSNLSAYLHFGHISALTITIEIIKYLESKKIKLDLFVKTEVKNFSDLDSNTKLKLSAESFLEELIVRKELAENFCFYNLNYNNIEGIRSWAKASLDLHSKDKREFIYSLREFENAKTHDSAWNACQIELITTGKIKGYLRMYWAKKILEWTNSAAEAIEYAIYLNDKYSLDGYDPNGYTGILWSIGGIHDRPWFNRNVFGQIRYMNFNGLKSKFNVDKYIKKWIN